VTSSKPSSLLSAHRKTSARNVTSQYRFTTTHYAIRAERVFVFLCCKAETGAQGEHRDDARDDRQTDKAAVDLSGVEAAILALHADLHPLVAARGLAAQQEHLQSLIRDIGCLDTPSREIPR
jgi:hypothetical protein